MPLREFACSAGHITERVLYGADDRRVQKIICTECSKLAKRLEMPTRTFVPSDDFFVAKSYERRKGEPAPAFRK